MIRIQIAVLSTCDWIRIVWGFQCKWRFLGGSNVFFDSALIDMYVPSCLHSLPPSMLLNIGYIHMFVIGSWVCVRA